MMRRRARAATAGIGEGRVIVASIQIYRLGNNGAERKLLMNPCGDGFAQKLFPRCEMRPDSVVVSEL